MTPRVYVKAMQAFYTELHYITAFAKKPLSRHAGSDQKSMVWHKPVRQGQGATIQPAPALYFAYL